MKNKTLWILAVLLISISVVATLIAMPRLPDLVASHWNEYGMADGYTPKGIGIWLMPLVSVGLALLMFFLPKIDPLKANIAKFRNGYNAFILAFLGFFTYLHIISLLWNLGLIFNYLTWMVPAMAGFMYMVGVLLSQAQPNYFIGIRTPWTLANPLVWQETHRFGGRAFKVAAVISLAGIVFPGIGMFLFLVPVLVAAFGSVVYSYILFKRFEKAA